MDSDQQENKPLIFKVLNVRENEDGSAACDIEYDKEVLSELFFKEKGVKEPTKEQMDEYIHDLIMKASLGLDGYSYKNLSDERTNTDSTKETPENSTSHT